MNQEDKEVREYFTPRFLDGENVLTIPLFLFEEMLEVARKPKKEKSNE